MKKKHLIVSVIIATSVFISSLAFAVEFGPHSAKITNRYYPATLGGWSHMQGAGTNWAGRFIYANVVGIEEVSGAKIDPDTFSNVQCLKVNMIMAKQEQDGEEEEDDFITVWVAQDTEGNLWILKIYIFPDNDTFLLGILNKGILFKSMFMPAVPAIGDSASITIPEDDDNYCEVVEVDIPITTNYGSYTNCIKTTCFHKSPIDPDDEEVEYYCPDVGEVRASTVENPTDVIDLKNSGTATTNRAVVIPLMD